jgi:two-component system invasion response regulator UvrY
MTDIRVMLTDDHAVMRTGMARLLERSDDIHVVGEADSGEQAYQLYSELEPDVMVMDMSMPGIGGLEALRRIKNRFPKAKVIMFSMHEHITFAIQAMTSGAVGFVAKSGEAQELVTAVKHVMTGQSYLSGEMAHKIALQNMSTNDNPLQRLTAREFEVFRMLAEGKLVEEIAEILQIGQKTVSNYQTSLKQKLDIHSSVDIVRLAMKYEVINNHYLM